MRKILFSIFAGGLILVGCSKDGGSGGSASIVGTWDVNSIITTSYLDGTLQGSDTTTEGNLQFESNGNFTSTDESGDTTQGVYTYSNGNLSVISDGDTTNVHVTNLTETNLHFTEDESGEISGISYRITADADLTRQ